MPDALFTPAQIREEADCLAKGEAWYYVDSPAFRRRYDTEHTQAMLRQGADDRENLAVIRAYLQRSASVAEDMHSRGVEGAWLVVMQLQKALAELDRLLAHDEPRET